MNKIYDDAVRDGEKYYNDTFIFDRPVKYGWKYTIRMIQAYLINLMCQVIIKFIPNDKNTYRYEVSICSIFKNEASFLKEWIEYHLLIGVDHFYLYNNNSTDNFFEILEPYIDKGIVTLTEWPENPGQISSYRHWYINFRQESRWITFLDLDEFYCPLYNNSLKCWLSNYQEYPLVMVYWKMFGTSGKFKHDYSKLVIEQYINSWGKIDKIGKLFYQTRFDIASFSTGMMHYFKVKYGILAIPPVNSFKRFVVRNFHFTTNKERDIQLNHYWSKAYNAYLEKHQRGDAAFGVSPRNFDYFMWHETRNNSVDFSIFRFLMQLKLKLKDV